MLVTFQVGDADGCAGTQEKSNEGCCGGSGDRWTTIFFPSAGGVVGRDFQSGYFSQSDPQFVLKIFRSALFDLRVLILKAWAD